MEIVAEYEGALLRRKVEARLRGERLTEVMGLRLSTSVMATLVDHADRIGVRPSALARELLVAALASYTAQEDEHGDT